jgi:dTDP-4-dehydrorhamnose reductase
MGKLKVLVLGDGILGSEIVKQTNCNYLSRKKDGISIDNFDEWLHKMSNYDVIINCIANTDTYSDNKESHWDINYKFVELLITFCNETGAKLVHISTDYVYTDSISNASEEDVPVHCRNWYGYTKLLSDGLVQLQSENFLLCRCTHKSRPFPYESAWIDQVGNFDYVDKISDLIIKLIDNGSEGVYNVGTEIKSMYEMASETRDVGKILTPTHVPKNQTMDLTKLEDSLTEKPFFSIAIPTYGYNGRGVEFLDHSLEIIYKQTFKNYEVIISDHSTDDTIKNVYDKWKDKLNIKFYSNDKGRGIISPNINNAMKYCNGKWIKVLFQDDFLYDENSLQIQHDFINNNSNIKWFMTKFYHSNTGKDYYRLYQPKWMDNQWTGNNLMGCPSGLTIRNRDLFFFDEGLNWLMDVDYYQRMFIKYGKPHILDVTTAVNRTWGDRLTDTIPQSLKDKEFNMLKEKYD